MPDEKPPIKPKMKLASQLDLRDQVDKWVARVENPEGLEARQTFGRHQTESERRHEQWRQGVFEIVVWLIALGLVALLVMSNWAAIKGFLDWALGDDDPVAVEIPSSTPVPSKVTTSMFSGVAYQLGEDLGWVRSDLFSDLTYYAAGEVMTGEYQGAKRYFAVGLLVSDSTLATYEFWQLPDGQVILNGEKQNPQRFLRLLNDYYVRMIFDDKVVMIDQLQGDWPQTLPVSASMILYRREVLTDLGPYDGVNRGSPRLALALPQEYYQPLDKLASQTYVDLSFYSKMYSGDELYAQIAPNIALSDEWIADRFLFGGSKVIVMDKTGVSYVYELVFRDKWENYQPTRETDLRNLEYYKQELIKYTATASFASYKERALAGQVLALPDGQPRMPMIDFGLPGINFAASEFEFSGDKPVFSQYTSAYTAVCDPRIDAKVVQNVSRDELLQVGRLFASQLPVYVLRDREHLLEQLAYRMKFTNSTLPWIDVGRAHLELLLSLSDLPEDKKREVRRGEKPLEVTSARAYAGGMPLLFIPDPWGRYLLVWENELDFLRECGIISDSSN